MAASITAKCLLSLFWTLLCFGVRETLLKITCAIVMLARKGFLGFEVKKIVFEQSRSKSIFKSRNSHCNKTFSDHSFMNTKAFGGLKKAIYFIYKIVKLPDSSIILYSMVYIDIIAQNVFWCVKSRYSYSTKLSVIITLRL